MILKRLFDYIKLAWQLKKIYRVKPEPPRKPGIKDLPPDNNKYKYTKDFMEDSVKLRSFMLIAGFFFGFFLFCGCSKNQDIKIVHNYWDKIPSVAERKQETYLDLYVYKKYKDIKGKEAIAVYKAD
jgi:hypothetical protein